MFYLGAWTAFLAAYLLFAGQLGVTEGMAGIAAATMATLWAALWRHHAQRRMRLQAPWPTLLLRPLAALLPDALRAGAMLASAVRRRPDGEAGSLQRQDFRRGSDAPPDAGRRGLVTLGVSFAPNGYVVDLPDGDDALVIHRLHPEAPEANRDWPL